MTASGRGSDEVGSPVRSYVRSCRHDLVGEDARLGYAVVRAPCPGGQLLRYGTRDSASGTRTWVLGHISGWLDGRVEGAGADSSSLASTGDPVWHNLSVWAHNLLVAGLSDSPVAGRDLAALVAPAVRAIAFARDETISDVLLTVTSTAPSATDLGFLLHKHPGKVQSFELSVGTAHVFYPEATDERCTAALLLEVDPIALVRGRSGDQRSGFSLAQYVNDRPYAASSMLAVALGRVYRTAIAGRCDARPDLPGRAIPLEIHAPAVPCRGGAAVAEQMFGPLGWQVDATPVELDPEIPRWGTSRYVDLRLTGTLRLSDALSHLYVLLPTPDADKHYWVGHDEIDKLMRAGEGWLATHPDRERIVHRYLANQRSLATSALERLAEVDDAMPEALDDAVPDPDEPTADAARVTDEATVTDTVLGEPDAPPVPLARRRLDAVLAAIAESGARSVVDLGCGEGTLLSALLSDRTFERLLGVDVSHRALQLATRRLRLETLPEAKRRRIELAQSSVTYRDARVAGFDAAVLMEVIEHVDPPRLPALERALLGHARPRTLIVTTPNVEYNVRFAELPAGKVRHHDHRFEWGRTEFRTWAEAAARAYGYTVAFRPVGAEDDEVGPPTQMAVLTRDDPTPTDGAPGTAGTRTVDATGASS